MIQASEVVANLEPDFTPFMIGKMHARGVVVRLVGAADLLGPGQRGPPSLAAVMNGRAGEEIPVIEFPGLIRGFENLGIDPAFGANEPVRCKAIRQARSQPRGHRILRAATSAGPPRLGFQLQIGDPLQLAVEIGPLQNELGLHLIALPFFAGNRVNAVVGHFAIQRNAQIILIGREQHFFQFQREPAELRPVETAGDFSVRHRPGAAYRAAVVAVTIAVEVDRATQAVGDAIFVFGAQILCRIATAPFAAVISDPEIGL